LSTVTTQLPSGTWALDKVHSHAGFSVKHMAVATFRGSFTDVDGKIADDRLEGVVRVESIDVRDENLRTHLMSPEFFDAENTPEIKFVSTAIRGNDAQLIVEGDLTIKGITRRVEATGTISEPHTNIAGATAVGIELETVVDRTAFGLDWNAPLPKGGFALGNDVTLSVHLELAKQED
jgi:polyisoprenoid-binding protein YceI